jgi:hypothetical protein
MTKLPCNSISFFSFKWSVFFYFKLINFIFFLINVKLLNCYPAPLTSAPIKFKPSTPLLPTPNNFPRNSSLYGRHSYSAVKSLSRFKIRFGIRFEWWKYKLREEDSNRKRSEMNKDRCEFMTFVTAISNEIICYSNFNVTLNMWKWR